METIAPTGLRDKKRAETRSRLENAALTLTLRDGLTHATIDAISEAADVSPRTFFNYFETKEDAVLGLRDIELTADVMRQHLARCDGADLVETVVRLLLAIIDPARDSTGLHARRLAVIRQHPELLSRHVAQMSRMADQLTAAIETLLLEQPAFSDDSSRDFTASAEVLMALCGGGVRTALREWTSSGSTQTPEQITSRAIELVREVTRRIQ